MEQTDSLISGAYEALRRKLIQTSLRNRMINYRRPSDRSTAGLHIEKEESKQIWQALVIDKKKFGFTGPADPPKTNNSEEGSGIPGLLPSVEEPENDTTDLLLYANVPKTKRNTKLLGTYRAAQEQLDERGVNTLYLVLGMTRWKEPSEQDWHLAPLVLVPVLIERTGRGDFRISYDEGEIGTNLSLKVKFEEFGISLPDLPAEIEAINLDAYFDEVQKVIAKQDGWEVLANEVALNFFSFEKIALYLDLALTKWAQGQTPLDDNDVIAALGPGYPPSETNLNENVKLDEVRSVEEAREIFEADSSQLLVIEEARRGTSMVVEGPPGTGKSQTITNLIAEMVSQGKKVLFVSEKMAALEVVQRKLEEAGIANAALELHGNKSNRRKFYEEIKRTWSLRSQVKDASLRLERLTELRNNLNLYVQELHEPIEPYGVSPRKLIALSCTLPPADSQDSESPYDSVPLQDKSWIEMDRLRTTVRLLQDKTRDIGIPIEHPFWGCALKFFGPDERMEAETVVAKALQNFDSLNSQVQALSTRLGIDTPSTLNDIGVLYRCVETALAAPPLDGVIVRIGQWKQNESTIREIVSVLRSHNQTISELKSNFLASAWEQDWTNVQAVVVRRADSFFGRLSGEYKQAQSLIKAQRQTSDKLSPEKVKQEARLLYKIQTERAVIKGKDEILSALYGVQWKGHESHPEQLEGLLQWVLKLEADVHAGALPEAMLNIFTGRVDFQDLGNALTSLQSAEQQFRQSLEKLVDMFKGQYLKLSDKNITDIEAKLKSWSTNLTRVTEIVGWNILAKEAHELGLTSVTQLASTWPLAAERLESHVLWHWSRLAIRRAHQERLSLQAFERTSHEYCIAEFKRLDDEVLGHNRARVAHAHLSNMPGAGTVGLTADLFKQCELKRGHKSVRWAFEKFSDLLLSIKPVCMMSPLSVATYLPPKSEMFDVVIFDEASQVKPEDALSAIARAKQVIVVGDTKQMPPTNFFDTMSQDDNNEDDSYDEAIGKLESVLALCSSAVQNSHRRRNLRWHYRSLHESLIQPSNRLFYGDELIIFPSPIYATNQAGNGLGLRFHYDPSATYDRGAQQKVNRVQADHVAKAIVEHMKSRPYESLLAVAFSKDQQQAILDAFEKLVEPGLMAEYSSRHPHEPFRVKNLETVQGDERDVIYVSVGYGRDSSGSLTMNFGPLNKEGGGRRLNVLITRAKKRTEVFTSIRSGDIVVDAQKENGVRALKVFLEFAETGILEDRRSQAEEVDSEFERQVLQAIEARGHQVDIQIGTAGFRIDLAVRHPEKPGLYVLGIECDGAMYHSAKSARDRDKLRQMVLESRGWRIHRIWSTDWWQNREEALRRCMEAVDQAILKYEEDEREQFVAPFKEAENPVEEIQIWHDGLIPQVPKGDEYKVWDRPFQLQGHDLHALPVAAMANCVTTVAAYEGPIHLDILIKRIRESAGLGRAGTRIRGAVLEGVSFAAQSLNAVEQRGDFIYWTQSTPIVARDRTKLPASDSAVDKIPPEEIDHAILTVVESAHHATKDEISIGVRKVFGFGAMPNALPAAVEGRITILVAQDKMRDQGGRMSLIK